MKFLHQDSKAQRTHKQMAETIPHSYYFKKESIIMKTTSTPKGGNQSGGGGNDKEAAKVEETPKEEEVAVLEEELVKEMAQQRAAAVKKLLTITDKHGNVIDITTGNKEGFTAAVDGATSKLSSLQIAASSSTIKSKEATGDALRNSCS